MLLFCITMRCFSLGHFENATTLWIKLANPNGWVPNSPVQVEDMATGTWPTTYSHLKIAFVYSRTMHIRYFSCDALVLFPLPDVNNDRRFLQNAEEVKKLHITSSFSWLRWLWIKTSATWQTFISGLFKDTLISVRATAITECWSRVGESVFSFCLSMSLYYI